MMDQYYRITHIEFNDTDIDRIYKSSLSLQELNTKMHDFANNNISAKGFLTAFLATVSDEMVDVTDEFTDYIIDTSNIFICEMNGYRFFIRQLIPQDKDNKKISTWKDLADKIKG